jgi:hypothetical protein
MPIIPATPSKSGPCESVRPYLKNKPQCKTRTGRSTASGCIEHKMCNICSQLYKWTLTKLWRGVYVYMPIWYALKELSAIKPQYFVSFCSFFFFNGSTGVWTCKAGALPLESLHKPCCDGYFSRYQNYLLGLALNHDPPGLRLLSCWDYRRGPPVPGLKRL